MNYYKEESTNHFFQELALRLCEAEIQTGQATTYHLPILYDGCQVCEANAAGMVTRHSIYLKSPEATAIYNQTVHIASQVREYMTEMGTARPLLVEGLDPRDGYRLLADFNDCVLAGRYSEYGCQFVTWTWDDEHKQMEQAAPGLEEEILSVFRWYLLPDRLSPLPFWERLHPWQVG